MLIGAKQRCNSKVDRFRSSIKDLSIYLIDGGFLGAVDEQLRLLLFRNGTIPNRRSTEVDEAVGFQIVRVEADLLPFIQGADGPDDCLRAVCQDLMVQLVVRLQRSLIRDYAVPVHQRGV